MIPAFKTKRAGRKGNRIHVRGQLTWAEPNRTNKSLQRIATQTAKKWPRSVVLERGDTEPGRGAGVSAPLRTQSGQQVRSATRSRNSPSWPKGPGHPMQRGRPSAAAPVPSIPSVTASLGHPVCHYPGASAVTAGTAADASSSHLPLIFPLQLPLASPALQTPTRWPQQSPRGCVTATFSPDAALQLRRTVPLCPGHPSHASQTAVQLLVPIVV